MQRREFMSLLSGAAAFGAGMQSASPAEPATVEQYGAIGNGKTNDAEAINRAIRMLSTNGGGTLSFDGSKSYYITKAIQWLPGVNLQGNGCTLITDRAIVMLMNPSPSWDAGTTGHGDQGLREIASARVVTAPQQGDRELVLSSVTGFSAGQHVVGRLGQNPDDAQEPIVAIISTIVAVDPARSTITLDRPVPHTVDLAPASPLNRSVWVYNHNLRDVWLDGFNFECRGARSVQCGICVELAKNIRISNITANKDGGINMGAGILVVFRGERITVENYRVYRNDNTDGRDSMGRCINISNCSDSVFNRGEADELQGSFAFLENYCENVVFNDVVARAKNNPVHVVVFSAGVSTNISYRNTRLSYRNGYVLDDSGGTESHVSFDGLACTGAYPIALAQPDTRLGGILTIDDGGGRHIAFDMNAVVTRELTRPLRPLMRAEIELEKGLLLDAEIQLSDDIRGLESIWFGTNFVNSWQADGALVPGRFVKVVPPGGLIGSNCRPYTSMEKLLQPATVTIAVHKLAIPAGQVIIRYRMAPIISRRGSGDAGRQTP